MSGHKTLRAVPAWQKLGTNMMRDTKGASVAKVSECFRCCLRRVLHLPELCVQPPGVKIRVGDRCSVALLKFLFIYL